MKTRPALFVSCALFALALLSGAILYPFLPDRLPVHWNLRGEIDGWMAKQWALLFAPGMIAAMTAFMLSGQWLSPRQFEIAPFRATWNYLFVLVSGLMFYIHLVMLQAGLNPQIDSGRILIGGMALFFAALGNVMGKTRRNHWAGVRTPWTLASDYVWRETHRLAGRWMVAVGIGGAVAALLGAPLALILVALMIALFYPCLYSFLLYKRTPPTGPGGLSLWLVALIGVGLMHATPTQAQEKNVSREVTFQGAGGFELKGTLLLPNATQGAKFPAVLLLPGSGAPDRDGNVRPFFITDLLKEIAERLAKEGIATLRFDKRSVAAYAKQWGDSLEKINAIMGWDAFVGDALAAYRLLRAQPEIDSKRVGVAGHSEGGLIALQMGHDLARKPEAPIALALLATAGRTLDVVLMEQLNYLLPRQIQDKAEVKKYLQASERAIAQVKKDGTILKDLPQGLAGLFNPSARSLLRSYFTLDPAELAQAYPGAVLVLQGANDSQVNPEKDAPRLTDALKKRKSGSWEALITPRTSHNLKTAETKEAPGVTGAVVPVVLEKIASWLQRHLAKP